MTRQKESNIVRVIKFKSLVLVLVLLPLGAVTQGGVKVQLVLNPDQAGYSPNQVVQVDVKLTQTPGGADQLLRLVEFDLRATNPFLTFVLPLTHDRGTLGTGDDIYFWSFSSLNACATGPSVCSFNYFVDDDLPSGPVDTREDVLSIAYYGLTANAQYQILLPASGAPVTIGRLQVTMPAFDGDYMLNLINAGDPDPVRGTRVDFGFDPHIIWAPRLAAPNDVTGGTVLFHVVSPLATSAPLIVLEPDVPKTGVLSFNVTPSGGAIGSATSIECDDSNVCTDDSGDPSSGCVHVNNANFCDDGLFCNGSDTCSGGSCGLHSGYPCPPNTTCNEATQTCIPIPGRGSSSLISFKAVKKNNVAIPPTNNLAVLGSDTIEVEFFLSDWATQLPAGIRTFQVKLDQKGFVSPDNGTALPLGWCAPVNRITCANSTTCPSTYPICLGALGCTCAGHNPSLGAAITQSRADFLLNGYDALLPIDTSNLRFRYAGIATEIVGVLDTGVPRYLGTVILKVSANACGTFTIGFIEETTATYIADPGLPPNQALPALQPLLLTVSDCSRQLLSCSPNHCNIDARIAHDRLQRGIRLNTNTIEMTFSKPATGMTAADFEITVVPTLSRVVLPGTTSLPRDESSDITSPSGDVLPGITSVTPVEGNPKKANILLNRRIQQTRWTCIRDKGSNKRCCMGSLPADVDGNRTSQPGDSLAIWRNLDGQVSPALAIEKCDTDRNRHCLPADVLMVVDLFTGADAFTEVNGDALPPFYISPLPDYECPNMRLPP